MSADLHDLNKQIDTELKETESDWH
jgi:hypothetical protein